MVFSFNAYDKIHDEFHMICNWHNINSKQMYLKAYKCVLKSKGAVASEENGSSK